jgi:hypothetical protein
MKEASSTEPVKIDVTYIPPEGVFCQKPEKSNTGSTFTVFGTATDETVEMGFKFEKIGISYVYVDCIDREGKQTRKELMPGREVDPTQELGIQKLTFSRKLSEYSYPFSFGKGWGIIWIIKRVPK